MAGTGADPSPGNHSRAARRQPSASSIQTVSSTRDGLAIGLFIPIDALGFSPCKIYAPLAPGARARGMARQRRCGQRLCTCLAIDTGSIELRIALAKTIATPADVAANLRLLEEFAVRGAAAGTRLLVAPCSSPSANGPGRR